MFDTTVQDLKPGASFSISEMPEPRIEPEMVLHLASAPEPGMVEEDLVECIDWVAHAFEVVFSIFRGWNFAAADAAAAFGVHGALLLGDKHSIVDKPKDWMQALATFSVELTSHHGVQTTGHGSNVLGGPLTAPRFLNDELARFPKCPSLQAGELITTGTLTEAMPAKAGDVWTTRLRDIGVQGLAIVS
jgi:2-oxo-3-hexenedioate decarboxylase